MNTVGLLAFALVGATKAIRAEFDPFGVTVVGLATAFVGGATRDVLVGRVPLALRSTGEVGLGVLGVVLAVGVSAVLARPDDHPITQVADAIGLAAFATVGAIVAAGADLSAFGVIAIATVNAVGGGVAADVLLNRSPFVLFEDFYASCAVLGASAYWLAMTLGWPGDGAAAACATVTVGTRLAAVNYGWSLPALRMGDTTRE